MKKLIAVACSMGAAILLLVVFTLFSRPASAADGDQVDNNEAIIMQVGPDWAYPDWDYRRPIVISSTVPLTNYQVLIQLNTGNFDFTKAKSLGQDVRITTSDGVTPVDFWIESWNNTLAYLWAEVPSLVEGNNTLYIYYGNPGATAESDGAATFKFFDDDWSGFSGTSCTNSLWTCPEDIPTIQSGVVVLGNSTGIISVAPNGFIYNAVGYRVNFGSGNGQQSGGFIDGVISSRTTIGEKTGDDNNLYLQDRNGSLSETILITPTGVPDWHNSFHTYEIRWQEGQSTANIDHGTLLVTSAMSGGVPNSLLPVTFYNYSGSTGTLKVDWVYVREYNDPEPAVNLGSEQGLVALEIGQSHNPEPVYVGAELTYILAITNTSSIPAPGVVVTDTLPAEISFVDALPSQGICSSDKPTCSLGEIPAGGSASIAIHALPMAVGSFDNLAKVGSPGYEQDLTDNISQKSVTVLADATAPSVTWVKPVTTGNTFYSQGQVILLETSAVDNVYVDRVEFKYWDPVRTEYVIIAKDSAAPYQAQFNSDVLNCGQPYFVYAYAYDKAGNFSRAFIFIVNDKCIMYVPLVKK